MPQTIRNRKGRHRRPLTRQQLEDAALHYVERFASSAENLRRVLMRRLGRAGFGRDDPDYQAAARWIGDIVSRLRASGVLDDAAYAKAQAASLNRRGVALRGIGYRLAGKGVAGEIIDAALATLRGERADADFKAAAALARKRRLGPYRLAADRAASREKDLAVLARAGFAYEIARRVISADDVGALERQVFDGMPGASGG